MRILVAEDDAILADGVSRTLRQSGYAVDWVKNGVEADTALDTDDFDLLILDIGLPKKSGLDVLKRRARDSRVPVLILTALDGSTTACAASTLAPTTTSPSRSSSLSWRRACARSRAAAWLAGLAIATRLPYV